MNGLINIDNRVNREKSKVSGLGQSLEMNHGSIVHWEMVPRSKRTNERTKEEQRFCLRRRADNNRRFYGR